MMLNTFLSVLACVLYVSSTYHSKTREDGQCGGEDIYTAFYDISDYVLNAWFVADFIFYAFIAEDPSPPPEGPALSDPALCSSTPPLLPFLWSSSRFLLGCP